MKDRLTSPYYTNKSVKARIDQLLFKTAILQANLGIDSSKQERTYAKEACEQLAYNISKLCPIFANNAFCELDFNLIKKKYELTQKRSSSS